MRIFGASGRSFGSARRFWLALMLLSAVAVAQSDQNAQASGANMPSNVGAPATLTLQDALQRARVNSPEFRAALTELGLAHEDRVQGRAGLLPNLNYNSQLIYTEGNNTRSNTPAYIANNGVHEYISLGDVHQEVSLSTYGNYRRAAAAEAVAKARAEIAVRGLGVTVVKAYYGLVVAQRKYGTEQLAAEEAKKFLDISQKLEKGGEVAHSDVIKARIQFEQQERDLQEARLEMGRSRLELAVLLFPNFNENFNVVDDLQMPQALPGFPEAQAMAGRKNPDLRAALASVQVADHDVTSAWGSLLPSASIDYFYGIDASHFATRQFDPVAGQFVNNLGSSIVASVQVPLWNWGANRSKLKQADLRRNQAQVELSFAQRQLLANLRTFYNEAETSRSELDSLQQSAELATESLRLITLRYQAGESTVLEVVDAQNTLTLARNAYADGQARYRTALATLQTVTGSF
ncbi:MAG: TolC family protein [Terriglobales bacterium]